VSRNLEYGRFLLLIAGDGIREGVENLTDFLDRLGRLEFTFGLVELALYRLPEGALLVQPRVLAKTMIVRRTVVRIDGGGAVEVDEEGEEQEALEEAPDPRTAFYQSFWEGFVRNLRLDDASQPMALPNRSPNLYFSLPPSGSQVWVSPYFAQSQKRVGVYLRFARGVFGEEAYRRLMSEQEEINRELGGEADWHSRDGKLSVATRSRYTSLDDPQELDRIRRFFAETVNRYISVFRPRLQRIAQSI
jgi:hypothetical protein